MSIARRLTMHSVHLFLRIGLVLKDRERGTGKYDLKVKCPGGIISIKMTGEKRVRRYIHVVEWRIEKQRKGKGGICACVSWQFSCSFSLLFVP